MNMIPGSHQCPIQISPELGFLFVSRPGRFATLSHCPIGGQDIASQRDVKRSLWVRWPGCWDTVAAESRSDHACVADRVGCGRGERYLQRPGLLFEQLQQAHGARNKSGHNLSVLSRISQALSPGPAGSVDRIDLEQSQWRKLYGYPSAIPTAISRCLKSAPSTTRCYVVAVPNGHMVKSRIRSACTGFEIRRPYTCRTRAVATRAGADTMGSAPSAAPWPGTRGAWQKTQPAGWLP